MVLDPLVAASFVGIIGGLGGGLVGGIGLLLDQRAQGRRGLGQAVQVQLKRVRDEPLAQPDPRFALVVQPPVIAEQLVSDSSTLMGPMPWGAAICGETWCLVFGTSGVEALRVDFPLPRKVNIRIGGDANNVSVVFR